jgi:hypothetical protein
VPDGDQYEYTPNDDRVEAEIYKPYVVRRAYEEGDGGKNARRQPILAAIEFLIVNCEKANRTSGSLRYVTENDVCQNEV